MVPMAWNHILLEHTLGTRSLTERHEHAEVCTYYANVAQKSDQNTLLCMLLSQARVAKDWLYPSLVRPAPPP